jgi:hypothetical protein
VTSSPRLILRLPRLKRRRVLSKSPVDDAVVDPPSASSDESGVSRKASPQLANMSLPPIPSLPSSPIPPPRQIRKIVQENRVVSSENPSFPEDCAGESCCVLGKSLVSGSFCGSFPSDASVPASYFFL